MELRIVNPDPRYSQVSLLEPAPFGYLHMAAAVRPRWVSLAPRGRWKRAFLTRLVELASRLVDVATVEKATVYDAVAFAPPSSYVKERSGAVHVARFDVVVLVETTSPDAARVVRASPECQAVLEALRAEAADLHVIAARNLKRVGDVDKARPGTFLFNYFVGDDPAVVTRLWDYMASWYEVETGMDNSTLLAPLEGESSDYVIINHARWDGSVLRFVLRQFSRRSFRTYMLANLKANRVGAMPVLYRLA